jgi:ArsR family transcriptional regulator
VTNPSLLARLAALGDLARLRVLRLAARHELSVGELARALQLPQSTVSRHLKVLHDTGFVGKRTEGTASLYELNDERLDESAAEMWRLVREQLGASATFDEDDSRLAVVLAERREAGRSFFGRVGREWDHLRRDLFGDAFTAEALLGLLRSDWCVADLGCGTGNASELIAPYVGSIIAIDREPAMLEAARKRLAPFANVEFRAGDLVDLPVGDGELDAAMIFLVLHHLERPAAALRDAARTLRADRGGGVLLVVDMVEHDREEYRHTMGHQHLGFAEKDVRRHADEAGLGDVVYRRLRPDTNTKGPGLFAATMRLAGRKRSAGPRAKRA